MRRWSQNLVRITNQQASDISTRMTRIAMVSSSACLRNASTPKGLSTGCASFVMCLSSRCSVVRTTEVVVTMTVVVDAHKRRLRSYYSGRRLNHTSNQRLDLGVDEAQQTGTDHHGNAVDAGCVRHSRDSRCLSQARAAGLHDGADHGVSAGSEADGPAGQEDQQRAYLRGGDHARS